ncbi:MAG TPA: hypothetical protein PKA77_16740 [Chitinophagaceae bacterium]|jgi:hypothetical protein|nr:hypothetical protein [Chitinophagaceae bacterium]HMU59805.1 hypothetical protein [Chitinophagaceae bacterium]
MDIPFKTRHFYPDELRLLKTLKTQREKESGGKIKFYHFVIAGLLGAGLTYITILIPDSFWTFLFGTLAVFSFAFIVFMPYEIYKLRKKQKDFLRRLSATIEKGTVGTCVINAKRIAVAKEYEDEGDLFIIEYDTDKVLYLWDYDYNLRKKFPCLDFEIYDDNFFKLFGRQVYPLSDRIKPLTIDKKAKWNYMSKVGVAGHLQTENVSFDKLIEDYNNCA